jgi:cellulose synthase/poly-beta-1,6-N-acetylglucosamine synthase-like glycosyltransferase
LFRFVDVNKNDFDLKVLVEEFYITDEARNTLIIKALHMEEKPDYVMFVDADNTMQYNVLHKLINEDKDIISGIYFQRHKPFYPLAFKNKVNGKTSFFTEWDIDKVYEVDFVGAGCLLIKREVLEKMKYPYFYIGRNIEEQLTIGEDIMFCAEARRLGYKIWVHTGVNVGHIGARCVNINDWYLFKLQGNYTANCETTIKDIDKAILHKVIE